MFDIENISFLSQPNEFYERFISELEKCNEAYMCSLYIGTDDQCERILEIISKRNIEGKKTCVIVDKNRASRINLFKSRLKFHNIEDNFFFMDNNSYFFLPTLFREITGVLHSKIYMFDETIIISGANLQDEYFTQRMDRYLVIKSQPLVDYLYNSVFWIYDQKPYRKNRQDGEPDKLCKKETVIIPYTNKNEIDILKIILANEFESVTFSTAYINFTDKHLEILKDVKLNLIIPSPKAHTFKFNSKGEKYITENYVQNIKDVIQKLPNLILREYTKHDTTFHCKGLWCFGDDFTVTIIGSSNFNYRSIYRDIESNFVIISKNSTSKNSIQNELDEIKKFSIFVDKNEMLDRKVCFLSMVCRRILKKYL